MHRIVPCAILVILISLSVLAQSLEPWNIKPYTEWTPEETLVVLQRSPWVRRFPIRSIRGAGRIDVGPTESTTPVVSGRTEPGSLPGDGHVSLSAPTDRTHDSPYYVSVRWVSSKTLREGVVRYWQLQNRIKPEVAQELVSMRMPQIAIGVSRVADSQTSDQKMTQAEISVDTIRKTAILEILPSKRKVRPVAVEEVRGGALAPLADVMIYFPTEENGTPLLTPDDTTARFHCMHVSGRGSFSLEVHFPLKIMARGGVQDH